jgi:hypothetical protein
MRVDMLARWSEKGVDGPPTHRGEGGSGTARACGYTYYSPQTFLSPIIIPIPNHLPTPSPALIPCPVFVQPLFQTSLSFSSNPS